MPAWERSISVSFIEMISPSLARHTEQISVDVSMCNMVDIRGKNTNSVEEKIINKSLTTLFLVIEQE